MTDRPDSKPDPFRATGDSSARASVATLSDGHRPIEPRGRGNTAPETPERAVIDAVRRAEAVFAKPEHTRGADGTAISAQIVVLRANATLEARGRIVRERIDAAARPMLESYARQGGILTTPLHDAIYGPMPLEHPEVVRRLNGALHSEVMRSVIESQTDPALVPLNVRAGIVRMMSRDPFDTPPEAVQSAFPDWNKPLVPPGHHLRPWGAEDAAIWLRHFPPDEDLLHPIDTWDAVTAAIWLNDRDTAPSCRAGESEFDDTAAATATQDGCKPSLEVLHTLHELELEELAYRVFVERLRRETMPFYVSERRIHIRKVTESITMGYRSLDEARRSVRAYDLRRIQSFEQVFGDNNEWIFDLTSRIFAAHTWPDGFAEAELQKDFPDLRDG